MQREHTYTISDLSKRSKDMIAEAMVHPVFISQREEPDLVLMNIGDYRQLKSHADPRRSGMVKDMPDGLFEEFKNAVEAYAKSDETSSK